MSFGESVFPVGFSHKTTMEDLFVKGNYRSPPRKQRGKTLEDSRRLSTVVEPMPLTCGAGSPTCGPPMLASRCYVNSLPP